MRFGVAKDIITPIEPTMLVCTGVFDKTYDQIHDDMFVRCIVMDDGEKKAVIFSYDLIFHDRTLNEKIAEYAAKKHGIDKAAVVLTHTHSHTTPSTPSYNPYNPMTVNEPFERLLVERTKACLDRAIYTMFEGELEYGSFDADFNVSRRGKVNGKYKIHPNFDYVCDKEFFVMKLTDTKGNIRSIFCNYPCHPVFYPASDRISGEFPGRVSQLLECKYYGAIALYTQSSAGDVRPRAAVGYRDDGTLCFKKVDFNGLDEFARSMFESVCAFIEGGSFKKLDLAIAADEFTIELDIEPAPLSAFSDRIEYEKSKNNPEGNPNWLNAEHALAGGYDDLAESVTLHCQTLRLSDTLYVATVGGEPCFGVKNAVKAAFSDRDVLFIGYTDDCAYLVDDRVLSEGGYEPECFIEYNLKGPFKSGLDKKYTGGFKASFERIG